jgi:hypothetical protein
MQNINPRYDESSIRVLSETEAYGRMPWIQAKELAHKHHKHIDFVSRLLEACYLAGYPIEDAIARYLEKDLSIPRDANLESVFRELAKQDPPKWKLNRYD